MHHEFEYKRTLVFRCNFILYLNMWMCNDFNIQQKWILLLPKISDKIKICCNFSQQFFFRSPFTKSINIVQSLQWACHIHIFFTSFLNYFPFKLWLMSLIFTKHNKNAWRECGKPSIKMFMKTGKHTERKLFSCWRSWSLIQVGSVWAIIFENPVIFFPHLITKTNF